MSDGDFSSPSSAFDDHKFSDGDDDPDGAHISADRMRAIGDEVRCENCSHVTVCAYYEGIQSLLDGDDSDPFEAGELAAICDEFTPTWSDG